jgi:5-methylcytosine-specific restriction endonuclease McrA
MPYAPPQHNPRKGKAPRHLVVKNRQQTRAMHTGSKAWRALRLQVLVDEAYTCRKCGGFGDQVDHDDGDDSNNARTNLQCLCLRCHSAKTMTAVNKARR